MSLDYSVFDSLLDATFVVDQDAKVLYCNDLAASLCQSSVKRLSGKGKLFDFISFEQIQSFPLSENAVIETALEVKKNGKQGKVQLSVRQIEDKVWVLFLRDVSLEETLAAKYRSELQQKEDYAKNLEKLVAERTSELRRINKTLEAILDSLGQGFFTFNIQGDCGTVYTKACDAVIEALPKGRKAWDVLKVKESDREHFVEWVGATIRESLPFEDLKDLGPNLFPHSKGKYVTLEYYPIRPEGKEIEQIVVVATDKTAEHEAQTALETERRNAAMITGFVKNKEQFLKFLDGVPTIFTRLQAIKNKLNQPDNVAESFRLLHTLEGESAVFAVGELRALARVCQEHLSPLREGHEATPAIVKGYIDSLQHMETGFAAILSENAEVFGLNQFAKGRSLEVSEEAVNSFRERLATVSETLVNDYDDHFLKVKVRSVLNHYENLIQSVAGKLGKKVEPLKITGGDLRILPEQYAELFSSFVHAFRNALDHGLEYPGEREDAGKPAAGQIEVEFEYRADALHIHLHDDGRGIDPAKIRAKLQEKNPGKDFSQMSNDEVIQQVALPGFSSREEVGEFSGRGVGLDALRAEVLRMNGKFHIRSQVGVGTTIAIVIPNAKGNVRDLRSA